MVVIVVVVECVFLCASLELKNAGEKFEEGIFLIFILLCASQSLWKSNYYGAVV